jgi:hypothetical protein
LNHELKDVNVRNLLMLGGALCGITIGGLLSMGLLFGNYSSQPASGAPPTALEMEPQVLPQPHLQLHEHLDLERKRQAEDAILTSYGWVDRKAGVVRIPIERAMELVAEHAQARPEAARRAK